MIPCPPITICYEVPYMPANACFRDDRFRFIRHRCLNYYFKTTVTLFERGRYINIRELSGPSWRAVGASIAALESFTTLLTPMDARTQFSALR